MPQFEMVGIIKPDVETDAAQTVVERIGRRVNEQGGTVDAVDVWGKRRLHHPIGKYRDGIYFVTRFTLENERLPEIKRLTRIMDEMLRAMVVKAEGPMPAPKTERPAEAPKAEAPKADAPKTEGDAVAEQPGGETGGQPADATPAAGSDGSGAVSAATESGPRAV